VRSTLRQGGGSTTPLPSAMWMRQRCSCTARWCGRHRETRLFDPVCPASVFDGEEFDWLK